MPKPRVSAAGGFAALAYTFRKGREAGGVFKLYKRMRSKNACKTCAYGMGGQRGGMVNEAGDMQSPIGEAFFREHSIKELETWSSLQMEAAGRLAFPIAWREGDTHFRRIGWDEALDRVAADLLASPREATFFYGSGRSSNDAAFLMQTLARAYGTANIHNCSYYCHQASGVALSRMLGSATSTLVLDDLDRADLVIVAGANPASNHPRLIVKLVEIRERGGTVLVINPVKELGLVRFKIPMFNFVRLSDGGETAPGIEIRSEVEVVCALAARLLPPGPFPFETMTDHDAVRRAMAAVVPGYAPIATIGATKAEFQIPGAPSTCRRLPRPRAGRGRRSRRFPRSAPAQVSSG